MTDRRSPAIRRLELTAWAICVLCLGFVLYSTLGERWYQHRAEAQLAIAQTAPSPRPTDEPSPLPAVGEPLGRLIVPRLDLTVVVAEGTSADVLRRSPGRLRSAARPLDDGNLVIAGHRDTHFRPLEGIEAGDEIRLETPDGSATYRVEWTRVVDPSAVELTAPTGEAVLTLVTCYPFRWVGPAPERFVVRAHRSGPVRPASAIGA